MSALQADFWDYLRQRTPARIALGRTGDALPTHRLLEFELAHAKARDAVKANLDPALLAAALADYQPAIVRSQAPGRTIYLQRPDLGRKLAEESRQALAPGRYDATVVLADGLSARAVQVQGAELCKILLSTPGIAFAAPVIALQARVALGDEIAARQGALLAAVLIGERPGLSCPESLGAYITFDPKPGATTDSERNCISNISAQGLTAGEAARRILAIMALALRIRRTGTSLKEDDALGVLPPAGH